MYRPGPNTVGASSTDYPDNNRHAHMLSVEVWNEQVAQLVIHSDEASIEALLTVEQAAKLLAWVERATLDAGRNPNEQEARQS